MSHIVKKIGLFILFCLSLVLSNFLKPLPQVFLPASKTLYRFYNFISHYDSYMSQNNKSVAIVWDVSDAETCKLTGFGPGLTTQLIICRPSYENQNKLFGNKHESTSLVSLDLEETIGCLGATEILPFGTVPVQDGEISIFLTGRDLEANGHKTNERGRYFSIESRDKGIFGIELAWQLVAGLASQGSITGSRTWQDDMILIGQHDLISAVTCTIQATRNRDDVDWQAA